MKPPAGFLSQCVAKSSLRVDSVRRPAAIPARRFYRLTVTLMIRVRIIRV
jgi:hypothetical protein